jgi:hypothetical protein
LGAPPHEIIFFHLPDEGNRSALETIDQEFCEQLLILQYETNPLGGKVAL